MNVGSRGFCFFAFASAVVILTSAGATGCRVVRRTRVVTVNQPFTPRGLVVAVAVTPARPRIAMGTSVQLVATAIHDDGSTEDVTSAAVWTTSAPGVATFGDGTTKGLASGVGLGDATLTAALGSVQGAATVSVTPAKLLTISVTPIAPSIAAGTTLRLAATGLFDDLSVQDLTGQADWTAGAEAAGVLTVGNDPGTKGFVSGTGPGGPAGVAAALAGVIGSTQVTVTPAKLLSIVVTPEDRAIPAGAGETYRARGVFDDGSFQDLTEQAVWAVEAAGDGTVVATISNDPGRHGRVHAEAPGGPVEVTADLGGVIGSTTITITPAKLLAITVLPSQPKVAIFTDVAFHATGFYDSGAVIDLTQEVTWSSSDPKIPVSNADGSRGVATGTYIPQAPATISAKLSGVEGSTTLGVVPAHFVSILVVPEGQHLKVGDTLKFNAFGVLDDKTAQDITENLGLTFGVSDDAKASVSNAPGSRGLVTGKAAGKVAVTADFIGLHGSVDVDIVP